ncbi:ABC transporter, periplasmic domain [Desulfamplus magnetovallimortis]|uniref:ABC transporter, periplasmic domain n=1 Tax=Desulfamplus magnetovallimortis TaxID=1246637 RepID=A0A1W1HHN7_9BACT|nr:transporter substrate-binding domain-containing protein [Desulfamplus magnetovallimortis]SLM31960.1 ABC transporter, periplasmic domain [Desulfamplus magnetovallimortis]
MRNLLFISTMIITTLIYSHSFIFAETITIVADRWCPYNCKPDSDRPGYGIEAAKIIFERAGHTVDYSVVPWARALKHTSDGKYNAVIGAFIEDAPDFIFPENEIGVSQISFFVKKGNPWKYTGIESLESIKAGIILDYSYGENLDKYFSSVKQNQSKVDITAGDNALISNIKKLDAGRIDAAIEDTNVFYHTAKQINMLDKVSIAGNSHKEKLYIAFSPALSNSKQYADLLSEGINQLRDSGELKTILDKYGLIDWK